MSAEISPAGKPSGHGSAPELRASHADRDRVVEHLRVAAGDGRLTAEELEERLEAALSARTVGELGGLTSDLPPVSVFGGVVAAEVRDVLRIQQKFSPVKRTGPWVLPRRLELSVEWCEVTLDLTQAVITQDTLQIDMDMRGKNLTLIVKPGIVVDPYGLSLEFSKITNRQPSYPDAPITLRVELTGKKSFGRVVVREARRTGGLRRRGKRTPSA